MSRVQIPSLAPIFPTSFFWSDFSSVKQRPLDEPVTTDCRHDERTRRHKSRHEHGALAQFPDEWEQDGRDDELSNFDPEVERNKWNGRGHAIGADAEVAEGGGEAQSMYQAETEREKPAYIAAVI